MAVIWAWVQLNLLQRSTVGLPLSHVPTDLKEIAFRPWPRPNDEAGFTSRINRRG